MHEPQEDEFALNCLTQMSPLLGWTFPRRAAHYDRFLTFRDCAPAEIARWQTALHWFVQKLTYKHGRPLVLKSPCHTARIRLLLEVFPDAKFVHIHRNPYDVFHSSLHLLRTDGDSWWTLQRPDLTRPRRAHAPAIRGSLRRLFRRARSDSRRPAARDSLRAPGSRSARRTAQAVRGACNSATSPSPSRRCEAISIRSPAIRRTASARSSRTGKHEIARRWRRCFDEWGYAV